MIILDKSYKQFLLVSTYYNKLFLLHDPCIIYNIIVVKANKYAIEYQ